jgi:hypothetical protein
MTEIERWIETSGLNPRNDPDWHWEDVVESFPTAIAFEPYDGLWPLYCDCVDEQDGLALLDVPEADDDDIEYRSSNNWFPIDESCYIIVETKYVRPQ